MTVSSFASTRGVQELDQPAHRGGRWLSIARHDSIAAMLASLLYLVLRRLLTLVAPKHRSDDAAQIEILVLRHQLQVLRRQVKRLVYRHGDHLLLAAASRILPKEHWGAFLVRPETLLRWQRSLVARKWTRPHRPPGRPAIDPEVTKLILQMASENPRWATGLEWRAPRRPQPGS
jgi:putative transposase